MCPELVPQYFPSETFLPKYLLQNIWEKKKLNMDSKQQRIHALGQKTNYSSGSSPNP